MNEAIVSIGAGVGQVPLIRAAQRLGFTVIAVDRDADAPGMSLVEERIVCSTHDPEGVLAGLEPVTPRYRTRAVVTKSSGVPVHTTAAVARELGLAGLEPELARLATTKPGTMELADRAGIPTPRHAAVRSFEDLALFDLDLPLVVKPALTVVGKAGVSLAFTPEELEPRFAAARRASGNDVVEVEEYVEGRDAAVVGLFDPAGFQTLGLIDEDTRFDSAGRAYGRGFLMPSVHEGTDVDRDLAEHAARMVDALGLGTGIGSFTFRVGPTGEVALIEVHLDLAGDYVADRLFPAATGVDLLEATLLHVSGRADAPPRARARPVAVRFLFARDLDTDRAAKLAHLRALLGDTAVNVAIQATGDGEERREGWLLLQHETPAELAELAEGMDRILGRDVLGV